MPIIIRGAKGLDFDRLVGTDADEKLVGGGGEDWIYGEGGHDDAYGGRGNDYIELGLSGSGRALGGVGDDFLVGSSGHVLAGGKGDDLLSGTGRLFGDERPGLPQSTIGNDDLHTAMTDQGEIHATHTGGRGADTFRIHTYAEGVASSVVVTDFVPGRDKVGVSLGYTDHNELNRGTIWAVLDTNGDGTLGNDTPWDGNSAVTVGEGGLTIRLHEDSVTVTGISSLSVSDWVF